MERLVELKANKKAVASYVLRVKAATETGDSESLVLIAEAVSVLEHLLAEGKAGIAPSFSQGPWADLAITLHDCLLSLTSDGKLQDRISKVCEQWFINKWMKHDHLITQVIPYLLLRSLENDSKAADIKRLYAMVRALDQFDLGDVSSESLIDLIILSFSHAQFLRTSDGHKLLCEFLLVDINLCKCIHSYIKTIIPAFPKSHLNALGDVYFKAWKMAEGMPIRQVIEYECMQDLMQSTIHANHSGSKPSLSPFGRLREIVGEWHTKKKTKGVDEMLCRLYEPIIWRSLNVANASVRRNALVVLADIFPIQNPDADSEENNMLLRRQYEALSVLLKDDNPDVRCVAVEVASKIFAIYYEIIPSEILIATINIISNDLAFDSTSPEVRRSVIQGLRYMVQNCPLSHPLLKKHLIRIGKLIHDNCTRNRLALLDLLLDIKDLPDLKFWDVVELNHLMYRLEIDSNDVKKRIVALCLPSYFPENKSVDSQIARCLHFLENFPRAARYYYYHLPKFVETEELIQFVLSLYETLHSLVPIHERRVENSDQEIEFRAEFPDEVRILDCADAFLDLIAILFSQTVGELSKTKNESIRKAVLECFENYPLAEMLGLCREPHGFAAVFHLAKYALASNLTSLSAKCWEELQKGTASEEIKLSMLDCLFSWGLADQIFGAFADWIDGAGQYYSLKGAKRKRLGTQALEQAKLASTYLSTIMSNGPLRDHLFADGAVSDEQKVKLVRLLKESISTNLDELPADGQAITPYLTDIISLLLRLLIHGATDFKKDFLSEFFTLDCPVILDKLTSARNDDAKRKLFELLIKYAVDAGRLGLIAPSAMGSITHIIQTGLMDDSADKPFMIRCASRWINRLGSLPETFESSACDLVNLCEEKLIVSSDHDSSGPNHDSVKWLELAKRGLHGAET